LLNKPNDIEIFEDPLATFWFDKNGILNITTKPVTRTLENTRVLILKIKNLLGGKKVYTISDLTPIKEITEEARIYYKKH
jgi:hypothetical protein